MSSSERKVYGGWQAFGLGDFSPFGLKVKTYLRMVDLPYVPKMGDPRTAPTKKIPFIDDGGTIVGDSGLIIRYLKTKYGDTLDKDLTAEQHALGHVVRRTLEESAYFVGLYARWLEDEHWPEVQKLLVPLLPPVVGGILANGPIRGGVRKQAFAQGVGRHAKDDVYAIGCADVDAVAALLGDKPFLLGDAPSSYDATVYAFAQNSRVFPPSGPLSQRIKSHPSFVAYLDRMEKTYWDKPDPPLQRPGATS
jgi:glutathione S-transferase